MKALGLICLLFLTALAQADTFVFVLNRFGSIEIKTDGKEGEVSFYQGNKEGEKMIFRALILNYVTPGGVKFQIDKLPKPVIHDDNRRINSGDYKLKITGSGSAFNAVKARLPKLADFASTGEKMTFYGDKIE